MQDKLIINCCHNRRNLDECISHGDTLTLKQLIQELEWLDIDLDIPIYSSVSLGCYGGYVYSNVTLDDIFSTNDDMDEAVSLSDF